MKALRIGIQVLMVAIVITLVYFVYESIMEPVRYQKSTSDRETIIIEKLNKIKSLQSEFKKVHGRYSGNFDSLIWFYNEGKMPVVLKKGSVDTLTDEQALKLKLITRDTTYISIKDTLFKGENFKIENIMNVPFTNGKVKFDIKAGKVVKSNFQVPVFEVSCLKTDYLADIKEQELLKNDVIKLKEANKFPGLKLGSMEEPSEDGNWK